MIVVGDDVDAVKRVRLVIGVYFAATAEKEAALNGFGVLMLIGFQLPYVLLPVALPVVAVGDVFFIRNADDCHAQWPSTGFATIAAIEIIENINLNVFIVPLLCGFYMVLLK